VRVKKNEMTGTGMRLFILPHSLTNEEHGATKDAGNGVGHRRARSPGDTQTVAQYGGSAASNHWACGGGGRGLKEEVERCEGIHPPKPTGDQTNLRHPADDAERGGRGGEL